ncbi:MAG TPA: HAMP domain-containing sensor histidine kinase, partial [Prolixibacteraceae bacterium]|nr:HAMP domain-containing sensor histidine kinase [Prolixibacteraceae bacterium]
VVALRIRVARAVKKIKHVHKNNIKLIADLKQEIEAHKATETELLLAKEKAEESDRLKSAFLANMSHEIRTPMNSIMGFASLLPEEESQELMSRYAQIIVQNSEQLVHIIDDIVLYSRLQTKLLTYNPSKFDVNSLLSDIQLSFSLPEYMQKAGLFISKQSEQAYYITSDYEKLRQIFANLVSNAYKYTNMGSITIGYTSDEKQITLFVNDTGMGIPQNETDKIFDRFYRATNVNKGAIGGTGLGLSIVKELVELIKGKVWVETALNKGTTFYISLNH